jgi:hypothetical protein
MSLRFRLAYLPRLSSPLPASQRGQPLHQKKHGFVAVRRIVMKAFNMIRITYMNSE